jgi:hypothetical protein
VRRRFGIVKVLRNDGSEIYDVGIVSYDSDPDRPVSITRDPGILAVEGNGFISDQETVIFRLKMMIRDCENHPVYIVKE